MTFKVRKASGNYLYGNAQKPCTNATQCTEIREIVKNSLIEDENRNRILQRKTVTEERVVWKIDINTIEELIELIKEAENPLIVYEDEIMIYDDYVE